MVILKAQTAAFQKALDEQDQQEKTVIEALKKVEEKLVNRQSIFCSIHNPPEENLVWKMDFRSGETIWSRDTLMKEKELMEKDLLEMASEPALASLGMTRDLNNIFACDRICGPDPVKNKRQNGSLMWVYLNNWRLQVELQKHQRARAFLLSTEPTEK